MKYNPSPAALGAKLTDPDPFTTRDPVNPPGAVVGVILDPVVLPCSSDGLPKMLSVTGGETQIEEDWDELLYAAEIVAAEATEPEAVAANEAVVSPGETVTLAGMFTLPVPPDNATTAPPAGAGNDNVTAQVAELPLGTIFGVQASADTVGAAVRDIVAEA